MKWVYSCILKAFFSTAGNLINFTNLPSVNDLVNIAVLDIYLHKLDKKMFIFSEKCMNAATEWIAHKTLLIVFCFAMMAALSNILNDGNCLVIDFLPSQS